MSETTHGLGIKELQQITTLKFDDFNINLVYGLIGRNTNKG